MIDHTGIGVADVRRSANFYDAALGAFGLRRVMQMPTTWGPTASATASSILSSGSTDIIHTLSNSIPPSRPEVGPRLMPSTQPRLMQAGSTTGRPAFAGRITTPRSCSIQMVITSRRSSVVTEG
jgi:hypothetical protein